MPKIYKIDLHTHPINGLKERMKIQGIGDITKDVVFEIVKAIKKAGLNGIAITEDNNFNHGWVSCLNINEYFRSENLIIIPGTEMDFKGYRFLQLYIPPYVRRKIPLFNGKEWFYILAHPGLGQPIEMEVLKEINFDAVEERSLKGEFSASTQIALEKKIPLIQASDSQTLEDLGKFYAEI
jgi:hypothetical protein